MSISRLYSSAVNSVVGLRMLKPTLLTKMFRVPLNFLETSATKASREVASATSHTDPVTSKPTARHCKTAAVTSFAVRAHVWTRAPWRARDSTMAWLGGGRGGGQWKDTNRVLSQWKATNCKKKNSDLRGEKKRLEIKARWHGLAVTPARVCVATSGKPYPKPLVPPVTTAVLPSRRKGVGGDIAAPRSDARRKMAGKTRHALPESEGLLSVSTVKNDFNLIRARSR